MGRSPEDQGVHNVHLADDNGEEPNCYAGEDHKPEQCR